MRNDLPLHCSTGEPTRALTVYNPGVRTLVERWYGEGVTYDVVFDSVTRQFEVVAGEVVVFTAGAFVDVLHWCMRPEQEAVRSSREPIELPPPSKPSDED